MRATRLRAAIIPVLAALLAGCGTTMPLRMVGARAASLPAACRVPIRPDGRAVPDPIAWIVPAEPKERATLDAWCASTGPPVIAQPPLESPGPVPSTQQDEGDGFVVITWNLHEDAADLAELVRRLRSGMLTNGRPVAHFAVLAQEAMRADSAVPQRPVPGVRPPHAIRAHPLDQKRLDIVGMARALGLSLYYVPSMRNGAPGETDEDRGNAILATDPLSDFSAIELPFARQRRVAVGAAVLLRDSTGASRRLRLVSVHFESTVPARRLWIFATGARVRQARALLDALDRDEALVVGGDLNTWFGFSDPAYRTIAAAVPGIAAGDRRRTHAPFFRLDHLFASMRGATFAAGRRLDDRLGSDHYPILTTIRLSSDIASESQ